MSGVVLETNGDRNIEYIVMSRLERLYPHLTFVRMPQFSSVDLIAYDRQTRTAVGFFEIKSRKETAAKVRQYGGLLLKHRKIDEMRLLVSSTRLPATAVFAFENGEGELYGCRIESLPAKPLQYTGRRDRNLATDEEPVALLNWPEQAQPDLFPMDWLTKNDSYSWHPEG